ncbi:hypothetical protein [Laspinema palackyanum]|uniref:hypothetical protein n=1 Tax=Laspinema palackyanum TaxID=3231601 RepID=UPI00345DC05C|nr:hypothetical protein [Laspinema sp. D2c]
MLLLEHPETELHSKAIVGLGELFSLAVAAGMQVVIETQSDHLLNGIRRSGKRTESVQLVTSAIAGWSIPTLLGNNPQQRWQRIKGLPLPVALRSDNRQYGIITGNRA